MAKTKKSLKDATKRDRDQDSTQKSTSAGRAKGHGRQKPGEREAGAVAAFDIRAPKLPAAVEDAAFGSGDFPYDTKMQKKRYETELFKLQIEMLKLQAWVKDKGERIVIVFEGRDGAGKGGAIHRLTQHLNPRGARVVALSKPSDVERGQWYFQRYASQMPTRGEIVLFDRSWYNRAAVEPVMGFCTPEEHERFLEEAPAFESLLAREGVRIVKLFLTVGREMQMKRLHARYNDPLKRWKLSPIDFQAIDRFDDYSQAFETMLERTDIPLAPWMVIRANDKLRARLNVLRLVLNGAPYDERDEDAVKGVDRRIVLRPATYLGRGGEDGQEPRGKARG
jgi:polyphosphate kinase 2